LPAVQPVWPLSVEPFCSGLWTTPVAPVLAFGIGP